MFQEAFFEYHETDRQFPRDIDNSDQIFQQRVSVAAFAISKLENYLVKIAHPCQLYFTVSLKAMFLLLKGSKF